MRSWILISTVTVGLAAGALHAAGPDAKELAAKGYAAFKGVLAGDEARLPDAIRSMEESREGEGSNTDNLYNLARAYMFEAMTFNRQESLAKAERTFARIVELDPKRVDALAFHGSMLTAISQGGDLGKFVQGVQEMKTAIERSPEDVTSRIVLAVTSQHFPPQALAMMGNYDGTGDLEMVSKVFDSFHSNFAPHASVVMHALLADHYKSKGDSEKASANFRAALAVPKPEGTGALAARELLDKDITARMNGVEKELFADARLAGCHSCHLTMPEKILAR